MLKMQMRMVYILRSSFTLDSKNNESENIKVMNKEFGEKLACL